MGYLIKSLARNSDLSTQSNLNEVNFVEIVEMFGFRDMFDYKPEIEKVFLVI